MRSGGTVDGNVNVNGVLSGSSLTNNSGYFTVKPFNVETHGRGEMRSYYNANIRRWMIEGVDSNNSQVNVTIRAEDFELNDGTTLSSLKQSGVDAKAGVVASINAMGIPATTSDAWATLSAKIQQINRKAEGSLGALGTNYISVGGLSFNPSRVDIQYTMIPSRELITLTLFSSSHPLAASLGGYVGFYTVGDREGYRILRGSGAGQGNISGNSFWLNFNDDKTAVRWFAYE